MKEVRYTINWGGYCGVEDEYIIEVDDDATAEEIDRAVYEDYREQLEDNCSYEIIGEEE